LKLPRLAALALTLGCGGGGGEGRDVQLLWVPSGIVRFEVDGVNVSEGTGGYYVIGSCDHRDTHESNVTSLGSTNGMLSARDPNCPGAPFEIRVELLPDGNGVRTDVTVGPMPIAYASLSVPLDVRAERVEVFRTDASPLFVGGCGDVTQLDAAEGRFEAIHTPCPHGVGGVGLAETRRPASVAIIEGPALGIERRVLSGDVASVQFFRNLPVDVENSEVAFGPQAAGAVVRLSEEIRIY
jgi:hypothetical protein